MVTCHASSSAEYIVGSSASTASSLTSIEITTEGRHLKDQHNRVLILHGASVSGLNKLPTAPYSGFTHLSEGFFEHEQVSFVGRPFPLEHADEHFSRLQQWGLTFIRLVIPWESLEHEGPGIYDYEYFDYLEKLIGMMPRYGIKCYIDAHQDVWSRHTGGSGAPHWTLAIAGLDIRNLKATGAAHAHNLHLEPSDPPSKVWPSGYCKLAAATMATVFWAGDTFASKRKVKRSLHKTGLGGGNLNEDIGIEEFLQVSMIEAFGALGDRVKGLEAVMGFEVINEPHRGYIELLSPFAWDFNTDLAIGYFPSALQSWALGSGHPVLIDHYGPSFPVTAKTHHVLISPPKGKTAWLGSLQCIWQEHGVWAWKEGKKGELGEPVALRCDYFTKHPDTGKQVDWYNDFYWPFCQKFGERIGKSNPDWHSFVGPIPNEFCPPWPLDLQPRNLIYAPHWYDLQALFSKSLGFMTANVQGLSRGMFFLKGLYFGRTGLKENYALQIHNIINAGYRSIGERPVIIGETGVPFDLNAKEAFKTGDFRWQARMMDGICSALESGLVGFNLWNYNPLNNDEWGDSWNGENFSWFSITDITPAALAAAAASAKTQEAGKRTQLNVGARVIDAFERPYACKVAGIPTYTRYNMFTRHFHLKFVNPLPPSPSTVVDQSKAGVDRPVLQGTPCLARETEIYLPRRRFGPESLAEGEKLEVRIGGEKDGDWKYDVEKQTLYFLHLNESAGFEHEIEIWVESSAPRMKQGTAELVAGLGVFLLAILVGYIMLVEAEVGTL